MNYKIEVRTDIINPHTYLEIKLKYNELLYVLNECGGYVLFQQLYKWFGGKTSGLREIKKLEELRLLGSEQLNNNKYVYLKNPALNYLKYKDSIEEVTNMKPNKIIQKPGFRPIMNSVYSFQYLISKNENINVNVSSETFDTFIFRAKEVFKKDRFANLHLGKIIKVEFVESLKIKLKILGERNGIFLKSFLEIADFKSSTLEFVYFDFNQSTDENPVLRASRLISKFLNNVGTTGKNNLLNCCNFNLKIATFSEDRKIVLDILIKKTLIEIEKKNKFSLNSVIKAKENHVISNLKEVNIEVLTEIEGYLKTSTKGDSEFSFVEDKVIDRLENLREHLKGGK